MGNRSRSNKEYCAIVYDDTMSRNSFVYQVVILFFVALFVGLAWNGSRALWDTSETRYAEASREMAASGSWLVPRIDGRPHLTKPPVAYWLYGGCIKLFGRGEFGVRLPCAMALALTTLLTALITLELTRHRGSAILAGILYLVSPLALISSNVVTTDVLLAAAETAVVFGVFKTLNAYGTRARWWSVFAWTTAGVAFLIKGPPALLVTLVCAVFLLARRREYRWQNLFGFLPVSVFLVIALSWYVAVLVRVPNAMEVWKLEALHKVFVNSSRDMPAVNYLWILGVGALPAVIAVGVKAYGYITGLRSTAGKRNKWDNNTLFCMIWICLPLAIFMVAKTRLPLYVLPLVTPLAIMASIYVSKRWTISDYFDRAGVPMVWQVFGLVIVLLFLGTKIGFLILDDHSKDMRPLAQAIKKDAHSIHKKPQLMLTMPTMGNGLLYYLDGPPSNRMLDDGDPLEFAKIRGKSKLLRAEAFESPIPDKNALYIVLMATKKDKYLKHFKDYVKPVYENQSWVVWRRTSQMVE